MTFIAFQQVSLFVEFVSDVYILIRVSGLWKQLTIAH